MHTRFPLSKINNPVPGYSTTTTHKYDTFKYSFFGFLAKMKLILQKNIDGGEETQFFHSSPEIIASVKRAVRDKKLSHAHACIFSN